MLVAGTTVAARVRTATPPLTASSVRQSARCTCSVPVATSTCPTVMSARLRWLLLMLLLLLQQPVPRRPCPTLCQPRQHRHRQSWLQMQVCVRLLLPWLIRLSRKADVTCLCCHVSAAAAADDDGTAAAPAAAAAVDPADPAAAAAAAPVLPTPPTSCESSDLLVLL
jgi:hypothetical protein